MESYCQVKKQGTTGWNHTHTFTGHLQVGDGGTNKNLPPYYALAYIMKAII